MIDPRRKPQITQQLVYRVADRMAVSRSFIGKLAHARNIAHSCQLSRYKPYLPWNTICSESDLKPVHVHACYVCCY